MEAETRLGAILKDRNLQLSHAAAGRLFKLARLRAHPEEKLHELAHQIMKKILAKTSNEASGTTRS